MIKPIKVNPPQSITRVEYSSGICIDFEQSPIDLTPEQMELFKKTANEITEDIQKKAIARLFKAPSFVEPIIESDSKKYRSSYPFFINYRGS